MEAGQLLPQHPPGGEQGGGDVRQFRSAVDEFPDPDVEPHRPGHSNLEAEVAQQAPDVVLDRDSLLLQ
jgi:hypothetical protein